MRRSNLPDALFLGSAGAGVMLAYGVAPVTLAAGVFALSTPVFAGMVVRRLSAPDLRTPHRDPR